MAAQVIKIVYDVDTSELTKVDKTLTDISAEEKKVAVNAKNMSDAIKKGSSDAKTSTNSLNSSIKNVGVTIAAAFTVQAVLGFANEVIRVRGEFQKLEAVLTNTLGSKSAAQKALSDINTFAAQTNFGVVELTNAFVKLANQNLKPTVEELRNLADLANSTGKSFDMLTEAIIDARTFEFERLKEFGIRAKTEGDKITFTFKEQETVVKKTASAVSDYIIGLGKLDGVLGSTEAISRTLVGQVSNLGDSWDQLLNTIGSQSEGVLVGTISLLNQAIQAANELLQTDEQRGLAQAAQRKASNDDYVQTLAREYAKNKFLKDQDAQYIAAFEDGRNHLIQADFNAFEKIQENRVEAAKKTLDYLKMEVSQEMEITRGKTIAESLSIRQRNRDLLAAAQEYYNDLTAVRSKNEKQSQKSLDDEYKKQLALLKEREENTLREAKVAEMSKVYLLDIERDYNEDRVALFRKYNQQNLEELRGYNIRFKEIQKETNEAVEENTIKYKQIQTKKIDIDKGIDKSRIDSNIDALKQITDANIDAIDKTKKARRDADKEREEQQKAFVNSTIDNLQGLYNDLENLQKKRLQNELNNNENQRDRDLSMVKDNKEAQAVINAEYDNKARELKKRQAKEDKRQAEFNIIINAAQAVSKTLTAGPLAIPLSVLVGGLALAQLAIVESEPEPEFAKGGFTGDGKGAPDRTGEKRAGIVHEKEFVFDKHKTAAFRPMFEAIHRNELRPEDFNPKYSTEQIDYLQMQMAMKGAIKDLPVNKFSFDEKGFTHHLHTSNKKTEFKNKRYSSK